ncbi:MAG: class D sortase [Romboutsia sp.]|uniref:class D sortase n=1 Tax=Romboutsia sp. TaxID=1965302 RepID=UPI003F3874B2
MNNKYRKIIGITLIVLGVSTIGIRVGGKILFEKESKKEVYEFLETDIDDTVASKSETSENNVENTYIDKIKKENNNSKEVYENINTEDKIGVIEIPDLGVQHLIVEGTGKEEIKKNVGHFEDTAMPGEYGNFAVAGHRNNLYNEVFKGLADVEIGTEIIIKALHGEFRYQIYSKEVIEPENLTVLDQDLSKKEMTMITCTKDGKKRVCVKAKLIEL